MASRQGMSIGLVAALALLAGLTIAQDHPQPQEQERPVKESEVPAAAAAALKKLSGGAPITEYADEIEHGHKFYEGSWKGANGNVDGLVTEAGDLVELEETVPADKVPAAVRAEAAKKAGPDAKVMFEKKTFVLYEIHFMKEGKEQEMVFTPDGRLSHEPDQADADSPDKKD